MRPSERIYRILLKAYPKGYLRHYGEPMTQLFSDQLRGAIGTSPLICLWLRTLADLLRTVPARHFERLHGGGAWRRYSEPARRSLFFARYEATCLNHECITPEDLLAGLVREDREIRGWLTPQALETIRQAIGATFGRPTQRIVLTRMPLSDTVKQILALGIVEAEKAGTETVMPRHLAAAIIRQGQTLAADLLCRHGINLDRLLIPPE